MASDPPANKRSRTTELEVAEGYDVRCTNCNNNEGEGDDKNSSILEPIRSNVFLQSNDYAKYYSEAKPFPHGIIHNFCKEGFLGECCVRLSLRIGVDLFPQTPLFADGLFHFGSCNVMTDTRIVIILLSHIIFLQKLPRPTPGLK